MIDFITGQRPWQDWVVLVTSSVLFISGPFLVIAILKEGIFGHDDINHVGQISEILFNIFWLSISIAFTIGLVSFIWSIGSAVWSLM